MRWPRSRVLAGGLGAALIVGVGGFALTGLGDREAPGPAPSTPAPARATVEVTRQDLVVTQEVSGTLDHDGVQEVSLARTGTVTWLPEVGTVLARGDAVVRIDDQPVPLFLGTTPLYRELDGSGLRGADVEVVADNLMALGHLDEFPKGDITGPKFARGLREWRRANELPPVPVPTSDDDGAAGAGSGAGEGSGAGDGSAGGDGEAESAGSAPQGGERVGDADAPATRLEAIRPGDVVVLAEEVRVSAVLAQLGAPADQGQLLRVTSTRKVVRVPDDGVSAAAFTTGAEVTVRLAGGAETAGTVRSVGTSGEDGAAEAVIEVPDQAALEGVDSGTVTVRVEVERRPQVLSVPVAALLALAEGGHALQREDGTLVAVETGLFTADLVEVSGPEVQAGMSVVTAQ